MRSNRLFAILLAVAIIATPALLLETAAGPGCSKSAAKAATTADGSAKPCCPGAHGDGQDGSPCCVKSACAAALVALKQAPTDSPEAKQAVQAAVAAVEKVDQHTGCAKSRSAAQEAALVALKDAADATGDSKAQEAVQAVLVAANDTGDAEAQPTR